MDKSDVVDSGKGSRTTATDAVVGGNVVNSWQANGAIPAKTAYDPAAAAARRPAWDGPPLSLIHI